ncbi:DUF1080 domain-containing protein [Neolewinella lacunae]|uniref:DUF1080 domain-containing protein n=1 Tax=Neolewinella lacunae TaxID=1517758 RepID=A0A923T9U6_9BACT|nr:family 16 glycoside hydrolase [Neolewinella lacunae]MBC6995919.1 DUF1080 domain-containing protein [Neolewinella lacunae]MDN3635238.1 DUF1080 domain-containing protein [Neolewinella lacunae]
MRVQHILPLVALTLLVACGESAAPADTASSTSTAPAAAPTTGEWKALFNGTDLTGWHTYGKEGSIGSAWKVDGDAIYLDASNKKDGQTVDGGDIVTDESYGNYELELEWKIGECGNSGVIYNVQESADYQYPWLTGPEMQVLDNECHPDAKIIKHRAGDLYDLISVAEENVRPAGEWNQAKLIVTPGHVEQWLNGKKQVEYNNTGAEWEAMIAGSKFKDYDAFGTFTSGKISLQDHGDPVWFRNIRIREIASR